MSIRVLGIAPYPGLRDLLKELAADMPGIQIEVEIADLEEALPLAQRAEEAGYDVIISRGGTASLVRKHVSLPVVDISVSGYDILRVLTLVKDSNSKVAMIGFPNICQGAATVSSLLDFEIPIYSLSHESEVRAMLQKAFERGAQIVLGDVVTVRTAQEMGYHGILVTSGRESVIDALGEVRHAYDLYRRGQEKVRFFERVLEQQPHGVLVVDGKGEIRYVNRATTELIGHKSGAEWIGQQLSAQIPSLARLVVQLGEDAKTDKTEHNQLLQVGEKWVQVQIIISHRESDDVADTDSNDLETLIYLQHIENHDHISHTTMETKQERLATFAQFIGSSHALQQAIERAKTFASVDQHVWLSGPFGSGRCKFAQAIHAASERRAERFDVLTCTSQATEQSDLEAALFGTDGAPGLLHTSRGTIYLAEIDQLPTHLQDRLLHALQHQNSKPARLVVSSTLPFADITHADKEHSPVQQELSFLLGELYLHVPALSERLEDIDPISRVLIAEHNSQYGKHIVGMRNEVIERLQQHSWPGNVRELENVICELLLHTKGHYVGREELDAVWQRYESQPTNTHGKGEASQMGIEHIDLTGTWEQIEQRILTRVLEEEGMNQSKAAKRLGLNRSTLWRKLKE